jgi:hypothetical protein
VSRIYRKLTAAEMRVLDRLARMRDRGARAFVDAEFGRAETGVASVLRAALDPASPRFAERAATLAAIEAEGLARVARAPAARRFAKHQWQRAAATLFGRDDGDD